MKMKDPNLKFDCYGSACMIGVQDSETNRWAFNVIDSREVFRMAEAAQQEAARESYFRLVQTFKMTYAQIRPWLIWLLIAVFVYLYFAAGGTGSDAL
jgi:hypothetical protein